MNSVYVDQARLTTDRIHHRISNSEAVLSIGNLRLPVSRHDWGAVREAIMVAERIAAAAVFWKSDLEAINGQLEREALERQNAESRRPEQPLGHGRVLGLCREQGQVQVHGHEDVQGHGDEDGRGHGHSGLPAPAAGLPAAQLPVGGPHPISGPRPGNASNPVSGPYPDGASHPGGAPYPESASHPISALLPAGSQLPAGAPAAIHLVHPQKASSQ
ncbi:hypothetical protein OIE66_31095 [Nonomuraea sp. NBC_01738]|uniref:hypothetical protein n=1 Tax=Nonomuraea sp. NBC_01738 TaxID=2976003 RepID=UPI002E0F2640|nr:hypothetical protein OIE66_31095 [Nonomuraea sp. NBC_01738]